MGVAEIIQSHDKRLRKKKSGNLSYSDYNSDDEEPYDAEEKEDWYPFRTPQNKVICNIASFAYLVDNARDCSNALLNEVCFTTQNCSILPTWLCICCVGVMAKLVAFNT